MCDVNPSVRGSNIEDILWVCQPSRMVCRGVSSFICKRHPVEASGVWRHPVLSDGLKHRACNVIRHYRLESKYCRLEMATFLRAFSHDGIFGPAFWGCGIHAHTLTLHLPLPIYLPLSLFVTFQPCKVQHAYYAIFYLNNYVKITRVTSLCIFPPSRAPRKEKIPGLWRHHVGV